MERLSIAGTPALDVVLDGVGSFGGGGAGGGVRGVGVGAAATEAGEARANLQRVIFERLSEHSAARGGKPGPALSLQALARDQNVQRLTKALCIAEGGTGNDGSRSATAFLTALADMPFVERNGVQVRITTSAELSQWTT